MITTVTTVTTVTTIAAMGFTSIISIVATVFLILILTAKELTGARSSKFCQISSRVLNVGVAPMLMVFAAIVAVRIIEILN